MPFWLLIAYIFLVLTHLFSGITYHVGSVLRILPYVILCLFLMIVGNAIGQKFTIKNSIPKIHITIKISTFIAIIGAMMLTYDIIRLNDIVLGLRIQDHQISIIGVIGNIFASLGIIVWLYSLHNFIIHNTKLPLFAYLSFLSYVTGGILSAGRQAFILIILSTIIMILWSIKRKHELGLKNKIRFSKKELFGFIVLCSLFIGYFLFISSTRSRIAKLEDKVLALEYEFNATVSDETTSVMYNMGPLSDIYIEVLFYYSHELIKLDLIYQDYNYPPTMGFSQLSYVARRFQWLLGDAIDKTWDQIVHVTEDKNNFYSHTWGTFIINFIVDFGRIGTLIACLISGIIFGITYRSLRKQPTTEKIIRQCLMLAGIIFSIQFSPFAELIWTFPLLLIFFIKIKDTPKYVS